MRLFIQIRDGQPFEHPIIEDNFREAFPDIDPDNLPASFAPFERIAPPQITDDQILLGPTYEWVGDVVCDVWTVKEKPIQTDNP